MGLNSAFFDKKLGIIVCADDFGVSSDVNDAIIRLLEHERISAVFINLFDKIVKFFFIKFSKLIQLHNINSLFASFTFRNV